MIMLDLQLETLSPLAMRSDHAAQGEKTTRVISGSTFLGALATAHRSFYKNRQEEFNQFFLREKVFYPYLYPASFKGEAADAELPVYPAPRTAVSCKRHPGFLSNRDPDQHGISDSLLDWTLFKLSDERDVHRLVQYQDCPICQKPMEALAEKLYYRRLPPVPDRPVPDDRVAAKLKMRLQTRTGINRDWDIVESGILYSREIIEKGTRFWGTVRLPDHLVEDFENFVTDVNDAGLIHIGTGRTRGLGRVNLRTTNQGSEEEIDRGGFGTRLRAFNEAVHTMLGTQQQKTPFYFAITLHSPLLLHDPWLRCCSTISEELLVRLTKLTENPFRQIYQATSMVRVVGWNGVWGAPRVQEYAIDTGSVFLFSSQNAAQDLLDSLFTLERDGIGLRRAEGFGRICISDIFHTEGDHQWIKR